MSSYVRRENVLAIFVHGGAGSHSTENEGLHLKGLAKSAEMAMAFLKAGATAVEAVEVALKVLEDDHIFNAGVGSNLNIDGKVECDASIVDHFGRSGAAGAVGNVSNPISLARKIYEESFIDPGSCRINPNLLVGKGAEEFAWQRGVCVVTDSFMITPGARARFNYWNREWKKYIEENPPDESKVVNPLLLRPVTPLEKRLARLIESQGSSVKPVNGVHGVNRVANGIANGITHGAANGIPNGTTGGAVSNSMDTSQLKDDTVDGQLLNESVEHEANSKDSANAENPPQSPKSHSSAASKKPTNGQDGISDTVGAIAIDKFGNIAAGSSSGGIGLKTAGRVGPAALIGIGTHVVPVDPTDPEEITTATVTSGTGEQLATTLAAHTCAQRVYFSQKMADAGTFDQVTEEEALEAAIKKEFINHPSAVHNEVAGCIGVMAVKKSVDGIGFYFAHTTETMALCSMSELDKEPRALCSRNPNYRTATHVASGGLMIRGNIIPDPLRTVSPDDCPVN